MTIPKVAWRKPTRRRSKQMRFQTLSYWTLISVSIASLGTEIMSLNRGIEK